MARTDRQIYNWYSLLFQVFILAFPALENAAFAEQLTAGKLNKSKKDEILYNSPPPPVGVSCMQCSSCDNPCRPPASPPPPPSQPPPSPPPSQPPPSPPYAVTECPPPPPSPPSGGGSSYSSPPPPSSAYYYSSPPPPPPPPSVFPPGTVYTPPYHSYFGAPPPPNPILPYFPYLFHGPPPPHGVTFSSSVSLKPFALSLFSTLLLALILVPS